MTNNNSAICTLGIKLDSDQEPRANKAECEESDTSEYTGVKDAYVDAVIAYHGSFESEPEEGNWSWFAQMAQTETVSYFNAKKTKPAGHNTMFAKDRF